METTRFERKDNILSPENAMIEGCGKSYYANGSLKYEGEWKHSIYHGNGKLYHYNGEIRHIGLFNFGNPYVGGWKENIGADGEGIVYDLKIHRIDYQG
jgi:hypothetical protein